jgi:hypothetical protein
VSDECYFVMAFRFQTRHIKCKMDPMSICGTVIALAQAVSAVTAGLREIAALPEVPGEISDLHNEACLPMILQTLLSADIV